MDKYLKPSRFGCDPNAAGAEKQFKHWLRTFQNFVATIKFDTQTATASTTPGEDANATMHPLQIRGQQLNNSN